MISGCTARIESEAAMLGPRIVYGSFGQCFWLPRSFPILKLMLILDRDCKTEAAIEMVKENVKRLPGQSRFSVADR